MIKNWINVSTQLAESIDEVAEIYHLPSAVLNGTSVGQHVRHILECNQCLLSGYNSGIVSYDRRPRNIELEQNPLLARQLLEKQIAEMNKADKLLGLLQAVDQNAETTIQTNFFREVIYNTDHAVHHMAVIKIATKELKKSAVLDENYGVAYSTINYRNHVHCNLSATVTGASANLNP